MGCAYLGINWSFFHIISPARVLDIWEFILPLMIFTKISSHRLRVLVQMAKSMTEIIKKSTGTRHFELSNCRKIFPSRRRRRAMSMDLHLHVPLVRSATSSIKDGGWHNWMLRKPIVVNAKLLVDKLPKERPLQALPLAWLNETQVVDGSAHAWYELVPRN